MFSSFESLSKQGTAGLGVAISYYSMLGYTVSIPLNDTQKYDLIIDKNGTLLKVQVKTTSVIRSNKYIVSLRTCGGNRSGQTVHKFNSEIVDILFVLCENGDIFDIPSELVSSKSTLALNQDFNKYKYSLTIQKNDDLNDEVKTNKSKCANCGKEIGKRTKNNLCPECFNVSNRKVERPEKDKLELLLKNNTLTYVAEKHGVSINSIKKWCKSYDIDYKKLIR